MNPVKRSVGLTIALVIALFLAVGVASADPVEGNNAFIVADVSCENGWQGDVLVPANAARPGFLAEMDGLGPALAIPREVTVRDSEGNIVFHESQPGQGYTTVTCSYVEQLPFGTFYIELEVQWVDRGN